MGLEIDFSDEADHLEFLFTGTRGYVVIGLFNRDTKRMREKAFRWPVDKAALVQYVQRAEGVDVFVCPYPMESRERALGNATTLRTLHLDMDFKVPGHLRRDLTRWGFRLIASGTPGHLQAFARLSRGVTPAEHRGLEIALRDWGSRYGKTEKIADNDFMRIPGKVSMKNGNDVRIVAYGRFKLNVDKFIEELDIDLTNTRMPGELADVNLVPTPDDLPEDIEALMDEHAVEGTRSERVYNAVLTVAEAGYTRDEIHAILADYAPGVEKYGVRWSSQIDEVLTKTGKRALELYSPDHNFWDRRKKLRHIREYAYVSGANPWSTLALVLLNILHQVPPRVLMPGVNGTNVGIRSLNMYVILIGRSGTGKKIATDAARDAVDVGIMHPRMGIGSGEGIAKAFRRPASKGDDGKAVVNGQFIKTTKVIFDVSEVSTWNALAGRQGATLTPELLKGFAGEQLGFSNADDTKTNPVPADSYRMGLAIGAQPLMCRQLLANADSGLPQRFLWMPAKGTRKFDFNEQPAAPSPIVWEGPEFDSSGLWFTIEFTRSVAEKVFYERRGYEDNGNPLDSHAIVVKMRVAIALALLEGRVIVNDEDWQLATLVMRVSERTRDAVMRALAKDNKRSQMRRGAQRGVERAEEERVVDAEKIKRIKARVLSLLADGDWVPAAKLRKAFNSSLRDLIDQAMSELHDAGNVQKKKIMYQNQEGVSYRTRGGG